MNVAESTRTIAEDLLARAAEDWISAAEVIDLVRRSGVVGPESTRELAFGLISRLIVQQLITPGDIEGKSFVPWDCSAGDAITRIIKEWAAKPDPFVMPGEIVWLNVTPSGQKIGEAIWERERQSGNGMRVNKPSS